MKTIVIGLGGLGCRAVSQIYGKLDKRKVEAFGLDVDCVDLDHIMKGSTGLPCFFVSPIRDLNSTDLSVLTSILNNKEWFPFDHIPPISHNVGGNRAFGRLFFESFLQLKKMISYLA